MAIVSLRLEYMFFAQSYSLEESMEVYECQSVEVNRFYIKSGSV